MALEMSGTLPSLLFRRRYAWGAGAPPLRRFRQMPMAKPLVVQPSPERIVAPPNRLPQAAQERASRAHPPGRVEKHNGVRAFDAEFECLVVVAVGDPRVAGEQAALFLAPLALRRRNPARLPELEVEMNDRQAGLRSKRAREGALPRACHPRHEDAAAYLRGGIAHGHQCPSRSVSGSSTAANSRLRREGDVVAPRSRH